MIGWRGTLLASAALVLIAACGGSDAAAPAKPTPSVSPQPLDAQPSQEPSARVQTAEQVSAILDRALRALDAAGTVSFYGNQEIDGVQFDSDGRIDFERHVSDVSVRASADDGEYEFRTISRGDDVYGGYSAAFEIPRCWYHFKLEPGMKSARWMDHPVFVLLQDMQARAGGSPSQVHVAVEIPLDAAVFTAVPRLGNLYPGIIPQDLMVPAEIEVAQSSDTNWRKGEIKLLHFRMRDVLKIAERHGIDLITPVAAADGESDDGYRAVRHLARDNGPSHLRGILSKVQVELTYTNLGNPVPAPVPDEDQVIDVDPYTLDTPGSCETSDA